MYIFQMRQDDIFLSHSYTSGLIQSDKKDKGSRMSPKWKKENSKRCKKIEAIKEFA